MHFLKFPPHFKIHPNRIPRPNRPNENKIFRKITPSESVANIRLIFREENFIGMRKSGLIGVPFLCLLSFGNAKESKSPTAKPVINNKEKSYLTQKTNHQHPNL
ncbi:hypothetical protein ACLS0H_10540 [Avibacterium avium]|uniref:hypothetical protein n=1 Tax=Avibacterium avium TaxID=751 RepID=UPI003BF86E35